MSERTVFQQAGVPGYRRLRQLVVRILRQAPGIARFSKSLGVTREAGPGGPQPLRIRPGRYFPDGTARDLPIIVIVSTGLADGDSEKLARAVEHAQMMSGSFRPLFVIDHADFRPFRSRGYVVERVMRSDELRTINPRDSHGEYLATRVESIVRTYRAASVVPLPAAALEHIQGSLLRLIGMQAGDVSD